MEFSNFVLKIEYFEIPDGSRSQGNVAVSFSLW